MKERDREMQIQPVSDLNRPVCEGGQGETGEQRGEGWEGEKGVGSLIRGLMRGVIEEGNFLVS